MHQKKTSRFVNFFRAFLTSQMVLLGSSSFAADDVSTDVIATGNVCMVAFHGEKGRLLCRKDGATLSMKGNIPENLVLPTFGDSGELQLFLKRMDGNPSVMESMILRAINGLEICALGDNCGASSSLVAIASLEECSSGISVYEASGSEFLEAPLATVAVCQRAERILLVYDARIWPSFGQTLHSAVTEPVLDTLIVADFVSKP